MKQLLLAFFICLLFISCKQQKTAKQQQEDNTSTIHQLFHLFNKHDWKQMATLYADTVWVKDPSLGIEAVQHTHNDIIANYAALEQAIPDVKDSIINIYSAENNLLVVEFISTGTTQDGSTFKLPICSILSFENGKIIKEFVYYDNF